MKEAVHNLHCQIILEPATWKAKKKKTKIRPPSETIKPELLILIAQYNNVITISLQKHEHGIQLTPFENGNTE